MLGKKQASFLALSGRTLSLLGATANHRYVIILLQVNKNLRNVIEGLHKNEQRQDHRHVMICTLYMYININVSLLVD